MQSLGENSEDGFVLLAANGDSAAIEKLVMLHTDRLKRMVVARMDQRLTRRMEISDIIQEVHFEISKRLPEYLSKSDIPFFVWVRLLAKQKLAELVRRHVLAQVRDVRREQQLQQNFADSSVVLCGYFGDRIDSPSSAMRKVELREILLRGIETLPETDREILLLRHVEQLTSAEAAAELKISENTCRQRHLRALKRMKGMLEEHGITWEEAL
jgi:RNA polymerase sigma-70 factor, ECF subfamily